MIMVGWRNYWGPHAYYTSSKISNQSLKFNLFCISGLPKNRTADEIRDEMSKLTDGVTAVCIYNSYSDKTKTRGYAFVEYLTHRHAALARRKLVPGQLSTQNVGVCLTIQQK